MQKPNSIPEQVEIGRIYAWIHQRAEFLRSKENALVSPQVLLKQGNDKSSPKTLLDKR